MLIQNFEYKKNRRYYHKFLCNCGQTIILRSDSKSTACGQQGCTETTLRRHGKSHTRLYNIWSGMRDRCINNHKSATTYKERGIVICKEWDEFVVFETWALANGYKDTLTIDRIKIDKNYSPDNCEWVTRSENTKRQIRDGHTNNIKIKLDNKPFISIAAAARHIKEVTNITSPLRSIATMLERRIKSNNLKPYKGFIVMQCNEGG